MWQTSRPGWAEWLVGRGVLAGGFDFTCAVRSSESAALKGNWCDGGTYTRTAKHSGEGRSSISGYGARRVQRARGRHSPRSAASAGISSAVVSTNSRKLAESSVGSLDQNDGAVQRRPPARGSKSTGIRGDGKTTWKMRRGPPPRSQCGRQIAHDTKRAFGRASRTSQEGTRSRLSGIITKPQCATDEFCSQKCGEKMLAQSIHQECPSRSTASPCTMSSSDAASALQQGLRRTKLPLLCRTVSVLI